MCQTVWCSFHRDVSVSGYNVLTTQYTPPVTDLSACAKLSGAAFTGNVSVGGALTQGGHDVLTTQYTPPATDLSACAKLSGAAFTGNVSVSGYNVLTTQYTPPATDLSSYAPKSNPTFTGTLSASAITANSLSYVDTTTQVATDVMTEIHTINERYSNSVTHLTTEQQSAFNNWVGSTTGESAGIGGEVGLTLWEMYQMNNLKKQVANCVLNDFVPDPILYNIFRSVEVLPEGNLGYVRNGLTGLYYRLTMPAGISRIAAYVDDPATSHTCNHQSSLRTCSDSK